MRKKVKKLPSRIRQLLRGLIGQYLMRKIRQKKQEMARRIVLHFAKKGVTKKMRTRLNLVRNCVIAIQKFAIWSANLKRLHFRQVTFVWDLLIQHMCEHVVKKRDSNHEKKFSKAEVTLANQRKIIALESKKLGVDQRKAKSSTAIVNEKTAKSKFEVMLDFM